jgi:hypothetical protein
LEEILRRGDVHLDPPASYYCPYTPEPSIAPLVLAPASQPLIVSGHSRRRAVAGVDT